MNHRNVPVFEVDDALGVSGEWMRVAGNEGLAVALADDQRRAVAGAYEHVVIFQQDAQSPGPAQPSKR